MPEISLLRRGRKSAARGGDDAEVEVSVPANFVCPISLEMMRDPVTAPTGITYDRESVEGWLARGHDTCPVTGRPVRLADLVPNHATRRMIQDWCVANRARGVERVPTPRVPVGEDDAEEVVAGVSAAARRGDAAACGAAGRNGQGASGGSPPPANGKPLRPIPRAQGMCDALVGLVTSPVSSQATKAALVTAYYLVSSGDRAAARFAELGVVPAAVELLVDADKGTSEKALAVLDAALCADAGVESARAHALTVPVLVKKMFRVSDMATDFAVSALWRLCRAGAGAAPCRAEALRVGAFQKLLLLLQVGCAGVTKERASELLKMLNGSRGSVECIETVDFKGLKRPF
ncbi:hypothetical protein OsJ_20813 [Oryza sativa Japonica Group]|uniref:U-box domain-containing protein n=1 Tax=Oryza sativa subsp. japonica TaxID=39947 RepID=B9FSI8_ORYSJ|nr:hypothetical protein OsJ_20813 [Oryza sativa Japonica Group]